ncbi:glycosyltransferase [Paenibacillus sp. PAMC21692]|uniref:glycosyltransferase n=1 Tax=Paenibacillus sp. PAMC21692 TaxID=2762320 RepID=UPI00164DABF6|nr:glycosyltransferase [Paenibacillus sp. PAMC21692]QNK57213.1 glycosyltransferase [Paenibacillus sp. PAMC21692]
MAGIFLVCLLAASCAAGFLLFRRNTVPRENGGVFRMNGQPSVIIPARNEESNLPYLLGSLQVQSMEGLDLIVVDDHSEDRTRAIAESFGVNVIASPPLPSGWTGKNWAVTTGFKAAKGDILIFLDADVRLATNSLFSLLAARERRGGVLSVVPYHQTERFYERLSLIPNLLGLFAFTSPMERRNPAQGLYGACIVATREDYERAGGHEGVKGELLDDLGLGARFREAGIAIHNYIGHGLVSFRMYPGGIRSEVEGFSKGAVLSTSKLSPWTTLLVAIWLIGLAASESAPFFLGTQWGIPLGIAYVLYTAQIYYFVRYTGMFGRWLPAIHGISTLFFLFVMLYSVIQVAFFGRVAWKGREVQVGGKRGDGAGGKSRGDGGDIETKGTGETEAARDRTGGRPS